MNTFKRFFTEGNKTQTPEVLKMRMANRRRIKRKLGMETEPEKVSVEPKPVRLSKWRGPHLVQDPDIPLDVVVQRVGNHLKYIMSEFEKGTPIEVIKNSAPNAELYFISTENIERVLRYHMGDSEFEAQLKKNENPEIIQQRNAQRLQALSAKDDERKQRRTQHRNPHGTTPEQQRRHYAHMAMLDKKTAPKKTTFTQKVLNLKASGYDAATIAKIISRQATHTDKFERITPELIQRIIANT